MLPGYLRASTLVRILCFLHISLPVCAQYIEPTYSNVTVLTSGSEPVFLAADVFLPDTGTGPWPVVLSRTPYGKTHQDAEYADASAAIMLPDDGIEYLHANGIAVVIQDVRGRYDSQGDEIAFINDAWGDNPDGFDTVAWLRAQSWCNGKVATLGASANGVTQVLMAGTGPQGLTGQVIVVASQSVYHGFARTGGCFMEEMVLTWLIGAEWPYEENLSLIRSHPLYDAHWAGLDLGAPERAEKVAWPVVIESGWYDLFVQGAVDLYQTLRTRAQSDVRDSVYLVIGPYAHMTFGYSEQGEITYPANAEMPYGTLVPHEMEYLAHFLTGAPMSVSPPRVAYYTMGAVGEAGAPGNAWYTADEWPPPATVQTLALSPSSALALSPEATGTSITYTYDPLLPVPTRGGANFIEASGPHDQSGHSGGEDLEARSDVLVFTTVPLTEPLNVTGSIGVTLYVSTDAPDTDFTAKLTDVYPDGRSMLVCDSARRLGFTDDLTSTRTIHSGQIYRLDIDLGPTSQIFNTGHRIRLAVSSSNYPRFEANPNTGHVGWPLSSEVRNAQQTLYLGGANASVLQLPVVPLPSGGSLPSWALY